MSQHVVQRGAVVWGAWGLKLSLLLGLGCGAEPEPPTTTPVLAAGSAQPVHSRQPQRQTSSGVPDLQLQLMFAPSPATTSQPILLTATVRNRTQQAAQLPALDLVLPSDAAVTQLLTPGWQCQQTELLLRCQRDSFAGGDSNDLSFVLQPSQAASQLSVTAAISSQNEDCDPGNNQAAAVVTIERKGSQARTPGVAGGGFGCSVTAHPHAGPSRFGWSALLLAWLCGHVQRRRRQLPGAAPGRA